MASICRRTSAKGKVRYQARVRAKGIPAQSCTFPSAREAKLWASMKETDARAAIIGAFAASMKTMAEVIDRYLVEVLPHKSTRLRYIAGQRAQLNWWKERIGQIALSDLSPYILANERDKLTSGSGRKRAPSTVNRYLAALNHVFSTAVKEWGWLTSNPLAAVKKAKEPRGRTKFLTPEQMRPLLAAAHQATRKPLALIILLAVSTGARKGELLGIERANVDFGRRVIILYDTKNGDPRPLYLSDHIAAKLKLWMARMPASSKYVFRTRHADRPFEIDREWCRARKAAGLQAFRFHDLRHTAASWMAMQGATMTEIGEVLGHKSVNMTKRYSHLSITHTASVVEKMNHAAYTKIFAEEAPIQA